MTILEIKPEYVRCNPTLNECIDRVKQRIEEREKDEYHNDDWGHGYSQGLIDVYMLLTGMAEWIGEEE